MNWIVNWIQMRSEFTWNEFIHEMNLHMKYVQAWNEFKHEINSNTKRKEHRRTRNEFKNELHFCWRIYLPWVTLQRIIRCNIQGIFHWIKFDRVYSLAPRHLAFGVWIHFRFVWIPYQTNVKWIQPWEKWCLKWIQTDLNWIQTSYGLKHGMNSEKYKMNSNIKCLYFVGVLAALA